VIPTLSIGPEAASVRISSAGRRKAAVRSPGDHGLPLGFIGNRPSPLARNPGGPIGIWDLPAVKLDDGRELFRHLCWPRHAPRRRNRRPGAFILFSPTTRKTGSIVVSGSGASAPSASAGRTSFGRHFG
jgi:hypothetical protein